MEDNEKVMAGNFIHDEIDADLAAGHAPPVPTTRCRTYCPLSRR